MSFEVEIIPRSNITDLFLVYSKKLQDLRKAGPGQHLSMGTAIGAGIQALEALEDLHSIGYLHRFAIFRRTSLNIGHLSDVVRYRTIRNFSSKLYGNVSGMLSLEIIPSGARS